MIFTNYLLNKKIKYINGHTKDIRKILSQYKNKIKTVYIGWYISKYKKMKNHYQKIDLEISHKYKLLLESGSLLLMKGTTQHFWLHQLPKTKKQIASRINLTFRNIK